MIVNKPQAINNDVSISFIKEMTTDNDLALIRKCASQWSKSATGKIQYFGKTKQFEKVAISKDAKEVAEGIRDILGTEEAIKAGRVRNPIYTKESIRKKECAVYAAIDNRGKIQGVALVNLKGTHSHAAVLDDLIVNPERVKSIGKRPPISGTGTKLVQAACQRVLNGKGKNELGTISLKTSKTFYEKLGFEEDFSTPSWVDDCGMCLGEKKFKELCTKLI